MRCARCGWPGDEASLLSTHHTSDGWVLYRRCVCGAVMVELVTQDGPRGAQVELAHGLAGDEAGAPRTPNRAGA
jgi:hypothetical protein